MTELGPLRREVLAAAGTITLCGCVDVGRRDGDQPFVVREKNVSIRESVCYPDNQTTSIQFGSESNPYVRLRGLIFSNTKQDSLSVVPRFSGATPDRMTISVQTRTAPEAESDCSSGLRYVATIYFDRLPAYVEVVHDPEGEEYVVAGSAQRNGTELRTPGQ